MANDFAYALQKEARLIFSSVTEKSAPRGFNSEPKYSATLGISKEDFDAIVPLEVEAIKAECGEFSGKASDYYLACISGERAASNALRKAELDVRGKTADEAFRIKEKAEKRAALFRTFPGVLTCSSKFEVEIAKLENGAIKDIPNEPQHRAQAGKDLFYPGAWVSANVKLRGFRAKKIDDKDGVTGFLQNMLFIRNGERLAGTGPDNSTVFGSFKGYSPEDPTALAPGGSNDSGSAPAGDDDGF